MQEDNLVTSYSNKIKTELMQLCQDGGVTLEGSGFAQVIFVKADPFTTKEKDALTKALIQIGFDPGAWLFATQTQHVREQEDSEQRDENMSSFIQTLGLIVSPAYLVLADMLSAHALDNRLKPGDTTTVFGIPVLALGDFLPALASRQEKRVMWERLRTLSPTPHYL